MRLMPLRIRGRMGAHMMRPNRQVPLFTPTAVRALIVAVSAILAVACTSPEPARTAAQPAASSAPSVPAPTPLPSNAALAERAKPFELNTPYEAPPGDPLEHNTSGYAKTMCSAVFMTGLDPDVAAESVGYFTGPYEERKKVSKPVVDREKKEIRITLPNGVAVVARHFGFAGLHHPAARTKRRLLQARRRAAPPAGPENDSVANGRCAAGRSAPG